MVLRASLPPRPHPTIRARPPQCTDTVSGSEVAVKTYRKSRLSQEETLKVLWEIELQVRASSTVSCPATLRTLHSLPCRFGYCISGRNRRLGHARSPTPTAALHDRPRSRLQGSLSHPHVLLLYAAFEDSDHHYLILELATGGDLFEAAHRQLFHEANVAQRVLFPILSALDYMHAR